MMAVLAEKEQQSCLVLAAFLHATVPVAESDIGFWEHWSSLQHRPPFSTCTVLYCPRHALAVQRLCFGICRLTQAAATWSPLLFNALSSETIIRLVLRNGGTYRIGLGADQAESTNGGKAVRWTWRLLVSIYLLAIVLHPDRSNAPGLDWDMSYCPSNGDRISTTSLG